MRLCSTSRRLVWLMVFAFSVIRSGTALAIDLLVWTPEPGGPRLILPRLEGESSEQAILRYELGINSNPALRTLVSESGELHWSPSRVQEFRPAATAKSPTFIVLANEFHQMTSKATKKSARNFLSVLRNLGADMYMLPVASDVGLSDEQAREFREEVAGSFDAMLGLGGNDIHPSLYGQEPTHAVNTHLDRDLSELRMLQAKIRSGHGVVYGICRAHQLCAIAHGHELIQDISAQTASRVEHRSGALHRIKIDRDSLLFRLLGRTEIITNSFHHQAVVERAGSDFRPSARSDENTPVVEAAEFANGRGLTFQFHPEIIAPGEKSGAGNIGILRLMVDYAREIRLHGCATAILDGLSAIRDGE